MSASTKLSTSVKALCYLASNHPEPQNSSVLAENIGANASKLRKLLSMMVKGGIVVSTQGTTGGFLLKKNPNQIHLQEIYCAIEDRKAFHLDVNRVNGNKNNLNQKFNDYFIDLFADVQVDIENKMRKITIKSIMNKLNIKPTFK